MKNDQKTKKCMIKNKPTLYNISIGCSILLQIIPLDKIFLAKSQSMVAFSAEILLINLWEIPIFGNKEKEKIYKEAYICIGALRNAMIY